jgi:hypothetical protein
MPKASLLQPHTGAENEWRGFPHKKPHRFLFMGVQQVENALGVSRNERKTHMPKFDEYETRIRPTGAIRVTLPLSVAYDLEKFQQALRNIAQQTGHTGCTSGVDLTFLAAREYAVNPATLEVTTLAGVGEEIR